MTQTMQSPSMSVAPILVDSKTAARLLGVSRSTLDSWDSAGLCPAPVRLGGRVLWSVDKLRDWAQAGCPSREQSEKLRKGVD